MTQITSDSRSIYVTLPHGPGTYSIALPHTEAGLSRALRLLSPQQETQRPVYNPAPGKFSKEQIASAGAILRKLGLVG